SGKTALGSALDNNGNTLTKVVGSNTTTYAWDYENRMTSVTLPGTGGTVSFKYDPFGRRIYKSSSSATSIYAYDGDNLIEETNSSGAVVARYSGTVDRLDEPLAMQRSSVTSYYQGDGLGSPTSLSNAAGSLTQTYAFDSFGNQTASSGSITNPFRFTGREFDSETNLYFYRARYYDPNLGRFLGEDPIGFDGSIGFYTYSDNNPVNWTDPLGLDKVQVCCRPLRIAKPLLIFRIWHHCYIKITGADGPHTWGVLPGPGGQQPRPDDPRNSGGKCKDVPCSNCKTDDLRKKLNDSDYPGGTCPSCGTNYHNYWWRFGGNNSNTYVYNMINSTCGNPPREPRSPGYNYAPGWSQ
ncbi:MAG TPA: RHS repeat-associated core domain-containing protein, partial [Candidatus Sulfotelmatobacter sp.]